MGIRRKEEDEEGFRVLRMEKNHSLFSKSRKSAGCEEIIENV